MSDYRAVLRRIVEENEILDPTTFRHATLGLLTPPRDLETDLDRPVLRHLWRIIYLSYYADDQPAARLFISGGRAVAALPDHEDYTFVERLEAAHPGRGYPTRDWRVVSRDGELWRVEKDGITLLARAADLMDPQDVRPGGTVTVRMPPRRRYSLVGWYMAIGDHGPVDRTAPLVRIYFTVRDQDAAPGLLRSVVGGLNELAVPFQFKVANHPDALDRRDSCVAYVSRDVWDEHQELFWQIHAEHADGLREESPCFALRLAPGMSFAEEPEVGGRHISFGEHRCLLVAEAMVEAFEQGLTSVDDRLTAIEDRFRREGLDAARPYLNSVAGAPR
jgi:hypothetical protein